MISNRKAIASFSLITIFFLTFLGMRITLLDNSPKPKPKPRAVLNLFAKSASTAASSTKADFAASFVCSKDTHSFPLPSPASTDIARLYGAEPASNRLVHRPQDRSPPRC